LSYHGAYQTGGGPFPMKTISRIGAFVLLSLLVIQLRAAPVPKGKPEDVGMSTERLQRIEQMLERRIAKGEMTGAVAIVTMFRVASMTKPVTSVALMMMVEEGKVRLNDPVSRYIPEFKNLKVAVADPTTSSERGAAAPAPEAGAAGRGGRGGAPPKFTAVAAEREVTIKDLLTHVSGLASGPMSNSTVQVVARKEGEKLADYIPRLGGTVLEFQPGTRWAYSAQAGHDTLGRIVEIASGMPLNEFFQKRIFDPLGMKDITFWPSEAQWPRVASVYNSGANGLTKNNNPNGMSSKVYFMGSGGLISTAEDYIPFGIMLANGGELNGKRILSRKTVEMLRSAHVPDTLPGRAPGEGYGLGVRVVTNHVKRGTMLSDGTFGWSGVYGTHFFVDPVEQTVGVLLVQTSNREVNQDFEDLVAQSIID
jgi:CubicO group peptidase (beta-lactamase class C family)